MTAGRQPDPSELVSRYPHLADHIEQMVPALKALCQLGHESGESTAAPASSQRSGCLGDFRILREIGRGGMGVVYEVEQISLERQTQTHRLLPSDFCHP